MDRLLASFKKITEPTTMGIDEYDESMLSSDYCEEIIMLRN